MKQAKAKDFLEIKVYPIFIEEWNKTVYIREMTLSGIRKCFDVRQEIIKKDKRTDEDFAFLIATALVNSVVDKEGNFLFTEENIDKLSTIGGTVLNKLWIETNKINKIVPNLVEVKADLKNAQ